MSRKPKSIISFIFLGMLLSFQNCGPAFEPIALAPQTDPASASSSAPHPTPAPVGSVNSVSYSASSAIIPNPERGFFQQPWCDVQTLTVSELQAYRANDTNTLLRCMWYMRDYKNSPLPQSVLDFFQTQMDTIRAGGAKVVLLFAYTDSEAGDDAPHSVVMGHLDQLAPYLQRNSDVIASIDSGFIGAWGEWGSSQNYGFYGSWTAQNWIDRKAVVDKLLSILPADRTVTLRTPFYKTTMYGSSAISDAEAFSGIAKARIGHSNNCFLTTDTDASTYTNVAVDYPYLAQDTKSVPIGGETCEIALSSRSDCPTALQEMAMFHWSYINEGYYAGVLDKWKAQGCFTTIKQKLGYRFVLQSGTYSSSARVGGSIRVAVNLTNEGFASPFNKRGLQLVLRNNSTGGVYKVDLSGDPRRWLPGQAIAINQAVNLPANLPAGTYSLLLNLPDPASTLADRPEYSIQLANGNVWESNTGFNNLGATLTVSP